MAKSKKRNPLVFHPLMKKGGPHRKSGGAKRLLLKQVTRQRVKDDLEQTQWKRQ